MSYFLAGVSYILWDNIPRGSKISCPHIEESCTSTYYSDRKLGFSETVCTSAACIHLFTGNNIGPKGDLASRSLEIRLAVKRADPENRVFKHPDPIGWTENHRVEILAALYTILLGNPELNQPRDAPAKTRFKMWWRLVGSAVEHAAGLLPQPLDFRELFLAQEEEDEESASLADILAILRAEWPKKFDAHDVAGFINTEYPKEEQLQVREFLYPKVTDRKVVFSGKSVGKALGNYLDGPVKKGEQTLILRRDEQGQGKHAAKYWVEVA